MEMKRNFYLAGAPPSHRRRCPDRYCASFCWVFEGAHQRTEPAEPVRSFLQWRRQREPCWPKHRLSTVRGCVGSHKHRIRNIGPNKVRSLQTSKTKFYKLPAARLNFFLKIWFVWKFEFSQKFEFFSKIWIIWKFAFFKNFEFFWKFEYFETMNFLEKLNCWIL